MTFLLALTAGLLVFLGLDTLSEALELTILYPVLSGGGFGWDRRGGDILPAGCHFQAPAV